MHTNLLLAMNQLKTALNAFQTQWEKSERSEEKLGDLFESEIAKEVLCRGCFEIDGKDYVIEPDAIELYFHEEAPEGIKDHIMYHTNEQVPDYLKKRGVREYPYFEMGTFNLHPSGVDVTFEKEKTERPYRASFLIREYTYHRKGERGTRDKCPTHLFDDLFPYGISAETLAKIHWVKRERMIPEDKVKTDYRVNVAEYDYKNGKFEKKPAGNSKEDVTKNGKYIQCKRKWQFKIEQESKHI